MKDTMSIHETNLEHKALLEKQLWAVANELRGQMDSSDYQKYILGVIFYKYLSDSTERVTSSLLENDGITYKEAWEKEDYQKVLTTNLREILGYVIEPQYLYSSFLSEIEKGTNGKWSTDVLHSAFNTLIGSTVGTNSQEDFEGLFDDINLTSPNLGTTPDARNNKMGIVLQKIGGIDFHVENTEIDVLGDAYEYLIGQFASTAGKKGGEFYTPQEASTIVAKILAFENPNPTSVYDPTCGSGSLLLRIIRETPEEKRPLINIYGQELNTTTYNLARMNMILHGVRFSNFTIKNGNTLTTDLHKGLLVDSIGANPPYSQPWEHTSDLMQDPRYAPYGKLAPESKADFAFLLNMLAHLKPEGTAVVVLPHGVLFRGGAEGIIRKNLLEKKYLKAVIGLPSNIFYGTAIPTVILVFKKNHNPEDGILFIDASLQFVKNGNKNAMTEAQAQQVVDTYISKENISKYSRVVEMKEIVKNDYNLNISRYIDTSEAEETVDLDTTKSNITALNSEIYELTKEIESMISQLEPADEQE